MAAPVMSDDSIPLPEEVEHLRVPVIGAQGPAMMEDDGLRVLRTPRLVVDGRSVLDGDRVHLRSSPDVIQPLHHRWHEHLLDFGPPSSSPTTGYVLRDSEARARYGT